jgi:hypothetical protein
VTVREGHRRLVALAVPLLVLAGTSACSGDDDDSGIDEAPVLQVEPTEDSPVCMQVDENLGSEVETLPVIDCAEEHTHEVYAAVESDEEVWPGVEALSEFAQVACLEEFEPFVGSSPFDSALSYSWLVPSLTSWNEKNDRTVLCVLMRRDGSPLRGSMRSARI